MTDSKPEATVDLYRDTWVRYCGYANELGESFKAIVPKSFYFGSYLVSVGYVTADTLDKSQNFKKPLVAGDVFIWQMLASVMIPGFCINRVCHFSRIALMRNARFRAMKRNEYVVSCIGLSTIPFIVKPIDHSVDLLMDSTYRKYVLGIQK